MAVDGRKLSDTLRLGSDESYEHPCSPCAKEGRNVAAVKYCVDCNENICGKCVSDHNKFAMMRGHQISDKLRTETGKKRPELPTQRCDKHGGKLVDVYCAHHDEVGCATCIAVEHRTCTGISFIPEAAQSNKIIADINELDSELKAFLITLDTLTKQKESQKTHLNQQREQLLNEIRKFRKQINDHFDKMETDLFAQVESLFSSNVTLMNKCINDVSEITKVIERSQRDFEKAKCVNEAEMFVQQKLAKAILQEKTILVETLNKSANEELLEFIPNKHTEKMLSEHGVSLFGCVSKYFEPKSVEHIGDFSVRLPSDASECFIYDARLISGKDIVLTDLNNNRLKILDDCYTVTAHLDLPVGPNGLCSIDDKTLAVSLGKSAKIQFVYLEPLSLGKSFSVNCVSRGIYAYGSKIYVCSGGWNNEVAGNISVYSLDGELLRVYYEKFGCPSRIHISMHGKEFFISDFKKQNQLVRFNVNENQQSAIRLKKLLEPNGFSKVGVSQLSIAGNKSNNVILISEDGQDEQELLTEKDGIVRPKTALFDERQSRLVVCLEDCDFVKVFKIAF